MPAYKDKNGKWLIQFNYKDWRGNTKYTTKRGFATKREALAYEAEFKLQTAGSMDMNMNEFYEIYKEEHYPRIRESTAEQKDYVFKDKILPYFGEKKVRDISAKDIVHWQNELLKFRDEKTGDHYSKSYLKTIHNQLSAILNYACRYYDLKNNPAKTAGNIGNEQDIEMDFWTLSEYKRFSYVMMDKPEYYYAFETLYWAGLREGEMLALTKKDIDLSEKTINVNKTFQKIHGVYKVGPPKTRKGKRIVKIPDNLSEELKEYMEMLFDLKDSDRIFRMTKHGLYRAIEVGSKKAGVKKIRVHDLRHSHVSLLIDLGYSPVAIAERVGHESIYITYKYAHMFPEVQNNLTGKLNKLMEDEKDEQ